MNVIAEHPRQKRFLEAVESLNLQFPVAEIARRTGYAEGTISPYLKSKSLVSEKFIRSFSKSFELDADVLLQGPALKRDQLVNGRNARPIGEPVDLHITKGGNSFVETSEGYYIMHAPVVTVKARASYMLGWGDDEYLESLPIHPAVVKEIHRGKYLWFDIDGDSMDDGSRRSIGSGDKALGRQINRSFWRSKLHFKEFPFFIVVHVTHGIMCKEITAHDAENGIITCHSLNPNKREFPDFDIRLDECIQIFNIVKVERDARG